MKFLANENFPLTSYQILKNKDWDIKHIGVANMGVSDKEVMEFSIEEERVIITFDSDYGELVYQHGYKPTGVIFLRIRNYTPEYPAKLLEELLLENKLEVDGKFTVIDKNKIRQRAI